MAEALLPARDSFICPICLDLLKVPVTVPCGHSFCEDCIKDCWDQEDQKGVYSCPQCRDTFTPRPVLNKNTMLAELAKALRTTRPQAAPPADSPAGSGDVECDFCIGAKHKAVKSCLVCLASYCETHIQPHYQSPALKKHKLVDASVNLQEKICSLHDKLLEVFCRDDKQCICYLCTLDGHKGHNTVSATAEKKEKLSQIPNHQIDCKRTLQQKAKDVQVLKKVMEKLKSSAQTAVEDSERLFTELIESIERRRSEVKGQIRAQEKAELSAAKDLLEKLEQEMADLRRRDAELEQLSHTEDPIHFFQSFQSLPALPRATDLSSINKKPQFSTEFLKNLVFQMGKPNMFSRLEMNQISNVQTILPVEPKTRGEFLKCYCQLTLNPSRKNENISLITGNRTARLTQVGSKDYYQDRVQRYSEHWYQVLCTESLSGRCYWEVEIIGNVSIAVSYNYWKYDVIQQEFGSNNTSWSLECVSNKLHFRQNQNITNITLQRFHQFPSKIGVYVNTTAGILSFYSVSEKMTLLHRVHTSFTQPLYPGFGMKSPQSSIQICDPSEFARWKALKGVRTLE